MAHFIALDQSLKNTGWARIRGDEVTTGAWPLAENIGQRPGAFYYLRCKLQAIHTEEPLDAIFMEEPLKLPVDKLDKLVALYGLVATVEGWGYPKNLRPILTPAKSWRASWLGESRKGCNSEELKDKAVARARQYGFDPRSHDEAEALGILDHQMLARKMTPPWRRDHPFLETI